jgi:hypothetical protein
MKSEATQSHSTRTRSFIYQIIHLNEVDHVLEHTAQQNIAVLQPICVVQCSFYGLVSKTIGCWDGRAGNNMLVEHRYTRLDSKASCGCKTDDNSAHKLLVLQIG